MAHSSGTGHFRMQRLTAMLLIPLVIWFLWALVSHAGDTRQELLEWLASPQGGLPMAWIILIGYFHMRLGLDEVIDDYVPSPSTRTTLRYVNAGAALLLGGIALWSIIYAGLYI
ncbi:MAG: succinate dehydrogenase, hydrophobic membrane anchor protein [Parvularculaceae bacterium]